MSTEHGTLDNAVRDLARAGPICSECLGRTFAKRGHGLSNAERGAALRLLLLLAGENERLGSCWVCGDVFRNLDQWVDKAEQLVDGVSFDTYLFGVRLTPRLIEMESYVEERFGIGAAEAVKHSFNRAVGRLFDRRFPGTTVAFQDPHVSFLVDLVEGTITLHVASLYIYGRYQKLERGIPQTKWPCRKCRGRGCAACNQTGVQYSESVEGWIAPAFVEAAGTKGERFHGAGREDIDALMLGDGRPFVLELLAPRVRVLDLESLGAEANERAAGKVHVSNLTLASRAMVERVKETKAEKRYRAVVAFSDDVSQDRLADALSSLVGVIEQETPRRVVHRRADLVRRRTLHEVSGHMTGLREAEVTFRTEGGLYIKELVSGDEGRTVPSLSRQLDVTAIVTALDVIEVRSTAFPDSGTSMDKPPQRQ